MFDSLGRNIDYLRISLTDRCNLRCKYCMPQGVQELKHEDILSYEEILSICKVAVSLGIKKFKVTGGEPLVRKGAVEFLGALKKMSGVASVTLTTNGCLLTEQLSALRAMGLDGINISLDTMEEKQYKEITGKYGCATVLKAIKASVAAGIPTKVNVVLLAENEKQILPLAALGENLPLAVRFIELMPLGYGIKYFGPKERQVYELLKTKYADLALDGQRRGNGPAVYYKSAALQGCLGFISPNTNRFCAECNRVRLTSTGFLKPCLCYSLGVNLRPLVKADASYVEENLTEAFQKAISLKPAGHCFAQKDAITEHKSMNQIGG